MNDPPALRSDPPPRPGDIRPMSLAAAGAWASGTVLAFWVLIILVQPTQPDPGAPSDIIGNSACQAVAYLLGLFLILRAHAPDTGIRDFLGIRTSHLAFYPLAVLLGLALTIPIQTLFLFISQRWPSSPETEDRLGRTFLEAGTPKQIAIGFIIVLLGPLVEEIFFRGALFRPLRKRYPPGLVILVTSLFFAVSHLIPQTFLPIAIVGAAMGLLRMMSGSILPSLLLHATFNAIPFYAVATSGPAADEAASLPPLWMTATGSAATVLLLLLTSIIGLRTEAATRARDMDLR